MAVVWNRLSTLLDGWPYRLEAVFHCPVSLEAASALSSGIPSVIEGWRFPDHRWGAMKAGPEWAEIGSIRAPVSYESLLVVPEFILPADDPSPTVRQSSLPLIPLAANLQWR